MKRKPIWGYEGYVNGKGEICHKTVIIDYKVETEKSIKIFVGGKER